jgi:hypothetical protein
MSYQAGSGEPDTSIVLIGCSTCGGAFRFPVEIARTTEGRYQCLDGEHGIGCFDRVNQTDDARLRATPLRPEKRFEIPGSVLPNGRT